MTRDEVWDLVLTNRSLIESLVKVYLPRHRRTELEDLYSDVVLIRCQRIMERFDPSVGVLPITFLCKNLKWYAMEWVLDRKYKKKVPTVPLTAMGDTTRDAEDEVIRDELTHTEDKEAKLRVCLVLERLSPKDAEILRWFYLEGYDDDEIAKHLKIRRREARKLLEEAIDKARRIADGIDGDAENWASHGEMSLS